MSEKRVPRIDSKNEWLLLSVTFTAKFELTFVLTLENTFSYTNADLKISLYVLGYIKIPS